MTVIEPEMRVFEATSERYAAIYRIEKLHVENLVSIQKSSRVSRVAMFLAAD
jgi:hypothetical protein